MDWLSLDNFQAESSAYDDAVLATPDIDQFCTSSDWILPAHLAFMPSRTPWLFRCEHGYVAMMQGQHAQGWSFIEPLEAMWGLASPVVGTDFERLVDVFGHLCAEHESDWDVLLLAGMPLESPLLAAMVERMSDRYEILQSGTAVRHVASLSGGLDGFLARRSSNFRRHLHRATRKAAAAGIEFEACHARDTASAEATYERILDVEERSWKGQNGVGINQGGMRDFYRHMIGRLATRAGHRTFFARHDGKDVGYVFGATIADTYRGLQMSYDADYRTYSLGSLCQYQQIQELCADGRVSEYDLGTAMDYKLRWAEGLIEAPVMLAVKRPRPQI